MEDSPTLGTQFATALAKKDFDRCRALMHPDVDFRGMTPSRFWEATDRDAVVDEILVQWFEPSDQIESFDAVETDVIADRERTGWRFSVRNPDGEFVVEQQAYLTARDGKIEWMRVMCSGFRPRP